MVRKNDAFLLKAANDEWRKAAKNVRGMRKAGITQMDLARFLSDGFEPKYDSLIEYDAVDRNGRSRTPEMPNPSGVKLCKDFAEMCKHWKINEDIDEENQKKYETANKKRFESQLAGPNKEDKAQTDDEEGKPRSVHLYASFSV